MNSLESLQRVRVNFFGALEITHNASKSLYVGGRWAFEMLR